MLGLVAAAVLAGQAVAAQAGSSQVEGRGAPACDQPRLLTTPLATLNLCTNVPAPEVLTLDNVARLSPGRWSGLVTDASTLKVSDGPVAVGGELMRIKVRQGYAARLTREFQGRGLGGAKVPAGELVYGIARRLSITMSDRPGAPGYETGMSGYVYLYCAPGKFTRGAAAPDRAMCFIDKREKNRIGVTPLMALGPKMNLDNQYTFVLSAKGESVLAPVTLEMAATMGVRRPFAEPVSEMFPANSDLILSVVEQGGSPFLKAVVVDSGGQSVVLEAPLDRPSVSLQALGGQLTLEQVAGGWKASFADPPVDKAIVAFEPDRTGS